MPLEPERYLRHLAADGEALAAAAATGPTAPVAACPGWTVAKLVEHVGHVHRWAAAMVRDRATERLSREGMAAAPTTADELVAWSRQGVAELLDALGSAEPDDEVWNWSDDPTARFWFRRQAQETAVHRWDTEQAATGAPSPIDASLAADGIDELLGVFVRGHRPESHQAPPGRLRLEATDLDRAWDIAVGDDGQRATATGTASDLLLFLWGRRPPEVLHADGETQLLTRWQNDIKI